MSQITPSAGLKKEPDSTPLSVTMDNCAALIDGNLYTSIGTLMWNNYSYGIDLGSSQEVEKLTCRAYPGTGTPTSWYSSSYDSMMTYKSDDGSTWTEIEQFDGPAFTHAAAGQLAWDLVFTLAQTARYFKLRCIAASTLAINPGGASLYAAELEAWSSTEALTQIFDEGVGAEDVSVYSIGYEKIRNDVAAAEETFVKSLEVKFIRNDLSYASDGKLNYLSLIKLLEELCSGSETSINLSRLPMYWREVVEVASKISCRVEKESIITKNIFLCSICSSSKELSSKITKEIVLSSPVETTILLISKISI